jgi:RNA ligase (TIGR02306 family)
MENVQNINETANIRKLATVAKILNISQIEDSDNLELAKVRGWNVVVKKNEFKAGDLCIYVEVDSVLPDGLSQELQQSWKELQKKLSKSKVDEEKISIKKEMEEISKQNTRPEFEFLRERKFRIKTREIFGQISQGICFPLSILNNKNTKIFTNNNKVFIEQTNNEYNKNVRVLDEDFDVTDIIGIIQYVAPEVNSNGGIVLGDLAQVGILVSDEERVENLEKNYEKLKQFLYYKTEKLEGTSIACNLKNGEFSVCGRNINYKKPENDELVNYYWSTTIKLNVEEKMREFSSKFNIPNFSLQGELVGDGIQGNIYKLKEKTICFYNSFDIKTSLYYPYDEFIDMIKEMMLNTVPILDNNFKLPETSEMLLKDVDNFYTVFGNNPTQLAEGWVFIAKDDILKSKICRSNFNRLSFKAKSRTYDKSKK